MCLSVCLLQWADRLLDRYNVVHLSELVVRREFDECFGL